MSSREHALYMTRVFNEAGITGGNRSRRYRDGRPRCCSARPARRCHPGGVRRRRVQRGCRRPGHQHGLFLRPTESSTVFLQQLGRGLRRATDKPVLTALDFVGHHRKEFRFDQRFRAMTGSTRTALERDITHDFPFLPAGTQIVLDRRSQEFVLENIRSQVTRRWSGITAELRAHPTGDLSTFLDESGVELADVVRGDRSWTRLRREAGLDVPIGSTFESGAPQASPNPLPR